MPYYVVREKVDLLTRPTSRRVSVYFDIFFLVGDVVLRFLGGGEVALLAGDLAGGPLRFFAEPLQPPPETFWLGDFQ